MTDVEPIKYEVQDHNIAAGYVTLIVDLWQGEKTDPAVGITRYIGVWNEDQLEKADGEAFDPTYEGRSSYYGSIRPNPKPLLWETLESVRTSDRDAEQHARDTKALTTRQDGYYARMNGEVDEYEAFLEAVERVAVDDGDEEAWKIIDKWRLRYVMKYEKA